MDRRHHRLAVSTRATRTAPFTRTTRVTRRTRSDRQVVRERARASTRMTPRGRPRDRAPRMNACRPVAAQRPRVARRRRQRHLQGRQPPRRAHVAADGTITEADDEQVQPRRRRARPRRTGAWTCATCVASATPGCSAASTSGRRVPRAVRHRPRRRRAASQARPELRRLRHGRSGGCGAPEQWLRPLRLQRRRQDRPRSRRSSPWKGDGSPAPRPRRGERMSDLDVLASGLDRRHERRGLGEAATSSSSCAPPTSRCTPARCSTRRVEGGACSVREKGGDAVGDKRDAAPPRRLRGDDGPVANSAARSTSSWPRRTTDNGAMSSVSVPFALKYGEDKLVAVCPDLELKACPERLPADGGRHRSSR